MTLRRSLVLLLAAVLVPTAVPAAAASLEEVIARHIEARGGRQAWQQVRSLRLTGTYTGFSKTGSFTLVKTRDGKVRFDHVLGGRPVVIAHDGELAWWANPWTGGEWPKKITGLHLRVERQDFDFVNPLFDLEAAGHEVELIGEGEIDGLPVVSLRLTRSSGAEETWHLDPETWLEVARDAIGEDLGGQEFPKRTFFDDFRDVGDVKIPFFVESEWYTRHRVMEVETAELDVALDDEAFAFPTPEGMAELMAMVGEWDVEVEARLQPGLPWSRQQGRATITRAVGGALIEEHLAVVDGVDLVRSWSWDRFRELYRLAEIESETQYLDVQTGTHDEEGVLIVSNRDTGTHWTAPELGFTVWEKTSLVELAADRFVIEQSSSMDGENFFVDRKMTYVRRAD